MSKGHTRLLLGGHLKPRKETKDERKERFEPPDHHPKKGPDAGWDQIGNGHRARSCQIWKSHSRRGSQPAGGSRTPPGNIGCLKRLGETLVGNRNLDEAEKIFARIIRLKPDESQAYFSLSAIRRARDQTAEAREILCRGVKQRPFMIRACRRRPLARLLRFRGVQNGYYTLGLDHANHTITKLRGGNFSDRHLIDQDKFTTVNFFILDDNLLACRDLPDYDLVVNSIAFNAMIADRLGWDRSTV